MKERMLFLINRIREKLWVRPLVICALSIGAAFAARLADQTSLGKHCS